MEVMAIKNKSKIELHEGKLLENFVDHTGLTRENFCLRIGISSAWLRRLITRKKITKKNKLLLFREFDLPKEYWEGTYKLSVHRMKKDIQRDEYKIRPPSEERIIQLQTQLQAKDEEIISLQKRIIELMERGNG